MIHEHDREAFDLVSELEEQSGFTMKSGRSLIQIVGTKHPASVEPNQLALFGSAGEEHCSSVVG
jgi:hypothetical protein